MSDAQRQRRRRDREREGLAIWGVEVDENETAQALTKRASLTEPIDREACCSALALAFAASPSPSLRVKSEVSSQRHSMSALPLKADIQTAGQDVRLVPLADIRCWMFRPTPSTLDLERMSQAATNMVAIRVSLPNDRKTKSDRYCQRSHAEGVRVQTDSSAGPQFPAGVSP